MFIRRLDASDRATSPRSLTYRSNAAIAAFWNNVLLLIRELPLFWYWIMASCWGRWELFFALICIPFLSPSWIFCGPEQVHTIAPVKLSTPLFRVFPPPPFPPHGLPSCTVDYFHPHRGTSRGERSAWCTCVPFLYPLPTRQSVKELFHYCAAKQLLGVAMFFPFRNWVLWTHIDQEKTL